MGLIEGNLSRREGLSGEGPLAQANIGRMLAVACRNYRDAPAFRTDRAEIHSYDQLAVRAQDVAEGLRAAGVMPDEPVMVIVSSTIGDLAGLAGCWWAGSVAVPVHSSAPARVREEIQHRFGVRFTICDGRFDPEIGVAGAVGAVVEADRLLQRRQLAGAAFVIFTSGSTGSPKGVVLGHNAFCGKLRAIQERLPFEAASCSLMVLKLNFSFGLWVSLLTLAVGGTIELLGRFDPLDTLQALSREHVSRIAVVPTMIRAWSGIADTDPGRAAFEALSGKRRPTTVIAGGEPLSGDLGLWLRGKAPLCGIADVYGLTETATSDFILPPDAYDTHPGSIGWSTPGVEFRIAGPADEVLGDGVPGELQIASPYAMTGYLGDEATTRAAFAGDFLRTGDIGFRSADGTVTLLGRAKEQIVRGGNKVSPLEIERVFAEHPAVRATLATGLPDDLMGERIGLLVVCDESPETTPEALNRWAADRMEKYKLPDRYLFGESLPVGTTGKADRKALARLFSEFRKGADAG